MLMLTLLFNKYALGTLYIPDTALDTGGRGEASLSHALWV